MLHISEGQKQTQGRESKSRAHCHVPLIYHTRWQEGGVNSAPTSPPKKKTTTLTATHPLLVLQLPLLLLDKQGLPLIFENLVGLGLELRLLSRQRLAGGDD